MLTQDGAQYTGNTLAELQARSQDKYSIKDIGSAYMFSLLCDRPVQYMTDVNEDIMVFNTGMEVV